MLGRGKYGVEWTVNPSDPETKNYGWIVVVLIVIALISLAWSLVVRICFQPSVASVEEVKPEVKIERPVEVAPPPTIAEVEKERAALPKRPQQVRNLLMKLEESRRLRDMVMEIATIEQLRALPGSPAADLDDALSRRLGVLNMRRLFSADNAIWVKQVTVRAGQSASRIAAENGSTLASFAKLNGGQIDRVIVGKKMKVMDHPRFNLVVHRRLRTADLLLNGKFFKRYDLVTEVKGAEGSYITTGAVKSLLQSLGVAFKASDLSELELLMPKGSPVLISEL